MPCFWLLLLPGSFVARNRSLNTHMALCRRGCAQPIAVGSKAISRKKCRRRIGEVLSVMSQNRPCRLCPQARSACSTGMKASSMGIQRAVHAALIHIKRTQKPRANKQRETHTSGVLGLTTPAPSPPHPKFPSPRLSQASVDEGIVAGAPGPHEPTGSARTIACSHDKGPVLSKSPTPLFSSYVV